MTPAPDIGALVEYGRNAFDTGPGEFRVSGWMRVFVPAPPSPDDDLSTILIREVLEEVRAETGEKPPKMQWCTQEEATHVSLSGICGAIAPIEELKVTGMVDWSEDVLASYRASAVRRGMRHELLF